MSVAFVQSTSGTNATGATSTTNTSAFTNPTVSGNTILVAVANDGSPGSVTSVTDTFGNPYKKITTAGSSITAEIWAAFNIKGGSSNVVTANQGFNDGAIFAHEYSGIAPLPRAVDQLNTGTGTTANPTMTTGTTQQLFSLDQVVFVAGEMDIVSSNAITVGAGFGNFTTASSNNIRGAVESAVVTTDAATAGLMVMTPNNVASWRICVATFRGTVSTPGNIGGSVRTYGGMSRSEVTN